MSTAHSPSQGMLPTDRGSKTLLSTLIALYKSDLAFRGMADFAVIGAVVMMFLNPPQKVDWPWSGGGNPSQSTLPVGGNAAGGFANAVPNVGPTVAGPVIEIPFPEELKSPRLGVGFLFHIDEQAFKSSSAVDRPRLRAALGVLSQLKADDVIEQLREANAQDPNVALVRGAAFVLRNTEEANRTAEALWRAAAGGGQKQAQALLGRLLLSGRPGVVENKVEGQRLIEAGVAAGDPQAMRFAGIGYLSGDFGRLDPANAAEFLKKSADAGDAGAMAFYSRMLAEGIAAPSPDGKQAEKYLRGAATAGLTVAQLTLGDWLARQFAEGLIADPREAGEWLTKAYERGHALDALNSLAYLYNGAAKGPPWKDATKAAAFARQCSGYAHGACQYNTAIGWLGGLYGGPPNHIMARAHFDLAQRLHFGPATQQLNQLAGQLSAADVQRATEMANNMQAQLKPLPMMIPLQYAALPSPPPPVAIAPDSRSEGQQKSPAPVQDADERLCNDAGADFRRRGEACDRVLRAGTVAGLALANAYFGRGWMRFNANEVDPAISDFTEVLKVQSDNYWSLNNRGALYASKNDLTRALSDFNEAIRINPKMAIAYANRGDVLRRQGKLGEGMADVRTALEIDGKLARALMVRDAIQADLARGAQSTSPQGQTTSNAEESLRARARTHIANKDYDSAIADLTDLIRNGSSNWLDFALRGLAYHRKGQPESALEDYNRAISHNGHDGSPHYNRALVYAQKGNLDAALSDLDAAIDQHAGTNADYLFERGRIHTRKSMHAQAVADYSNAIDVLSKDKSSSANDRALAYYRRGQARANETLAAFESCRHQQNTPQKDTLTLGGPCSRPFSLEPAFDDLNKAIEIKLDFAQAHFEIARLSAQIGQNEKAIQSYTAAIKADPSYSMAYNNRGVIYGNSRQRELAFADYNDAIRTDPSNKYAWANRGALFAGVRQRQRAIEDYRKALALDPNYDYALDGLARLGARR